MKNPEYDTVLDYLTVGHAIVEARHYPDVGLSLTGLTVDMDPTNWEALDRLEAGYDRVQVITTKGTKAYMYVGR